MQITLKGETLEVGFAKYLANDSIAIVLHPPGDPDEGSMATVYMNGQPPAEGCVWIKDYSENEGVLQALTDAGVIKPTSRTTQAGYAIVHEAALLVKP
jgi:hypothetical protein